ncbi:MAG: glycosyltransferase family 9 protein [Helicobacteraceae bacterium]|jgi:ADP-heptose:LPS heptosyltransferase|nr:glycosyltransferase family 9 protein [Helicobacteraceae bacterium]
MKILCIQLRQMGDAVTTTPAVRQLRALYPQAEIVFMSEKLGANVYQNSPRISRLWIVPRKFSAWAFVKLLWRVYRERFDITIDFFSNSKSAQIAFASRAKKRIGFDFRFRRYAYTRRINIDGVTEYAPRSKNRLIESLGGDINDDKIEFFIDPSAQKAAKEFTDKYDFGDNTIAFCVVSRRKYKLLDPAFWAEVGDALIAAGYKLWFVYGPNEKPTASAVFERLTRQEGAIIDYNMLNVQELRAILERCALYAGNDGGSKHLSVAAGIASVTVFSVVRAEDWTQTGDVAFQIEDGVQPQAVIAACLSILRKKRGQNSEGRS